MARGFLAYVVYVVVKLLNVVDRLLLVVFNRRLQRIDVPSFLQSLSGAQLTEMEDPDIREPVLLHVQGVHDDRQMSAFCRFSHCRQLKSHLQARVDHKAAIIANPDILKTRIHRPVFIIGLPRTGTSLLYNLLALDPGFRSPMMWEMVSPLPAGPERGWREGSRYKKVCRDMDIHKWLCDYDFDKIHYMRPDMPEECFFLLIRSLYVYHTQLRVSGMEQVRDWFFSRDAAYKQRLYTFYRQQLQVLGYGHGMANRHFLLKSHIHLLSLEALLDTFPDACLVFTHRKLSDVIPSFCSLMASTTSYYGPLDRGYGQRALRQVSEMCNGAARSFSRLLPGGVRSKNLLFLPYEDLLSDTVGTVDKIYDHFGLERREWMDEAVRRYLKENPRNKHGRHVYTLQDYGLSMQDIESACRPYTDFMQGYTDTVL